MRDKRSLFSTGSLGQAYMPAFRVWACWKQHSCLFKVPHSEGDAMCYVYHELEKVWLPWDLRSHIELGFCRT
jgi:hypothetical protein